MLVGGNRERKDDRVVKLRAWKNRGAQGWSEPMITADTPKMSDQNCTELSQAFV